MNNLLVIGLDGFTWQVADKIDLPFIQSITEEGGKANLISTLPPVTCPAWPSFLTGKYPRKHRAFDFSYLDECKNIQLTSYPDVKTPGLIETTSVNEIKSIFFEIPVTHPAAKSDNIVVAGYPASISEEKFNPPELFHELENKLGKFPPISPGRYTGQNEAKVIEDFTAAASYRKDAFITLLKKYDWNFATADFYISDQFSHYFWDKFIEDINNNPLTKAYKLLDRVVEEIVDFVPANTNIILMSDHGFGEQRKTINLNLPLIEGGFLKLKNRFKTKIKTFFLKHGLTPVKIKKILDCLNITSLLSRINRKKRDELLNNFLSYSDIDWEKSSAFSFGHMGQIYWIGNKKEEREKLRKYLLDVKSCDKNRLIDELIPLRNNPDKPSLKEPLWLAKMENWSSISYPFLLSSFLLEEEPVYSGCHRPEGILAWCGPDLQPANLENAEIVDLAPTIHRLLGIPLQGDFDGEVLYEILSGSAPDPSGVMNYKNTVSDKRDDENEEEKIEQLKNLGYL